MFWETINKAENLLGIPTEDKINKFHSDNNKESLLEITKTLISYLTANCNDLSALTKSFFSPNIYSNSVSESYYYPQVTGRICNYRIRPKNDYYLNNNKTIPRPDNPKGPDATGQEINFSLIGGNNIDSIIRPPIIDLNFEIWGSHERTNFKNLFYDYKNLIIEFITNIDIEFFTSCIFNRIENYRGSNIAKKLELYFQEDDDDENNFQLVFPIYKNTKLESIVKVFIIYSILYDMTFDYKRSKTNTQKLIRYYQKLFK